QYSFRHRLKKFFKLEGAALRWLSPQLVVPRRTGEAYVFAPGHDAWVVGDEEVVAYEFNTEAKDFAIWKNYKA
ncbi:MAG: hypothetical protein ACO3T2_09340, partial [Burkholderiaceae bacterium]